MTQYLFCVVFVSYFCYVTLSLSFYVSLVAAGNAMLAGWLMLMCNSTVAITKRTLARTEISPV